MNTLFEEKVSVPLCRSVSLCVSLCLSVSIGFSRWPANLVTHLQHESSSHFRSGGSLTQNRGQESSLAEVRSFLRAVRFLEPHTFCVSVCVCACARSRPLPATLLGKQ